MQNHAEALNYPDDYTAEVESKTEADFDAHCVALRALSNTLALYLERTWWRYKTKIVKCWTDKYAHFGCHDTSTVEGTHAKIKRWLESSKGDLLTVFLKLLPWWISSANAISYQSAKDASIIPHRLRYDQYSAVVRLISTYALIETDKLWKMAHNLIISGAEKSLCTGVFRHTYGRPCIHELVNIYESNGDLKILPTHFDKHWWILANDEHSTCRVLEPSNRRNHKSRGSSHCQHKAGHGANTTRRELSWFERDDSSNSNTPPVQSFQALLEEGTHESFTSAYLPPRTWGYSGLN